MNRRLVAALACRVQGTRLYGKPLQNLVPGRPILGHIIECIDACPEIETTVLGISEGIENQPFVDIAKAYGTGYIFGDQKDVLWRLVQCGRAAAATDIFRITTECPFTLWEMLPEAWARHTHNGNDVTVVDLLPEGVHFEIYTLAALERSHHEGTDNDRSEYASNYIRMNQSKFRVEIVRPALSLQRMDMRLTVDYPEDLVVCRRVYTALSRPDPRIPISEIIAFLDGNPDLMELLRPYTDGTPAWDGIEQRIPT